MLHVRCGFGVCQYSFFASICLVYAFELYMLSNKQRLLRKDLTIVSPTENRIF